MPTPNISRRDWLAALAASAASLPAVQAQDAAGGALKVSVFSKHFHWTDVREAAALSKQIGFDGIDLTVRKGGHVWPENVERDLPKAVETIRAEGLPTLMITTDIVDAKTPHAEAILRTASGLGIHHYRWGGYTYSYERSIADQLEEMKPRVAGLAALNQKYRMAAMYHTHSGLRQIGAPIWDLWYVLKDHDPRWVGINYDIGHATVEGGFGGWIDSARLVTKYMRGVALKDFKWGKNARGQWAPQWCAMGEGMVNFAGFFEILKTQKFSGPVQLHFEYPGLGGADGGKPKLEIPKEQLTAQMRKDLDYVRKVMRQAQLA
jgi:sugar phosphate isomerase/epimerase